MHPEEIHACPICGTRYGLKEHFDVHYKWCSEYKGNWDTINKRLVEILRETAREAEWREIEAEEMGLELKGLRRFMSVEEIEAEAKSIKAIYCPKCAKEGTGFYVSTQKDLETHLRTHKRGGE